MATPSRPPVRRPSSSTTSSSTTSPPRTKTTTTSSIIAKGATARSAISPRAIPPASSRTRTATPTTSSPRSSPVPSDINGHDALLASLKRETEEKEELLVRLQGKDAQIAEFRQENDTLTSAFHAAESRLAELYADQGRAEEEMATRMEIAEKLRSQVRDLEREKREALRRYAEQTASFEAERQALYDNEQHLKSRIQSLTAARKAQQEAAEWPSSPVPSISPSVAPDDTPSDATPEIAGEGRLPATPNGNPLENEEADISDGPEITALKLELSTLSTSHISLQTMVHMLQVELTDLKRVNNELQEENESYGLLLMERALSGTGVEMLRQMGGQDQASSRTESINDDNERSSIRSSKRSLLDRVPEDEEYAFEVDQQDIPNSLASELWPGQDFSTPSASGRRRRTRQNSSSPTPGTPVGESLADLPITGPGLDLAAELGRAESRDILDGVQPDTPSKARSSKNISEAERDKEVDALRTEVKSLKDANKALSLYASKIIDRIIMQDGFEQVLSVDYDPKSPSTPNPKSPGAFEDVVAKAKNSPTKPAARPQSMFLGRSLSVKTNISSAAPKENSLRFPGGSEHEKLTTFSSPASPAADARRNRRSLSFDWKSFSLFGGNHENAEKEKNLRPLTLRPGGTSTLSSARKLESHEDEEDRKERERLNATMKLMGIEKPAPTPESPVPLTARPHIESTSRDSAPNPQGRNRFSWLFGSNTNPADPQQAAAPVSLTSEALEQAEAESSLASLDAREKILTAEIAKGGGGGFTELDNTGGLTLGEQWRNRRSRSTSGKSHDSSGASTVWSAGKGDDE
ncbi:hypothetical protein M422DRAFT_251468 [Sphaerobolus stellatus SS14]|uniref:Uncharacterized protein n=1 Tax=Sphaerobolus stellatus (strain SS14) TaxID=990650 RepID=A0A0C9VE15_SPHS4|nr:hypothetical protein M422DRAFT_251468 [Sphaerobolus stellatus SS14]